MNKFLQLLAIICLSSVLLVESFTVSSTTSRNLLSSQQYDVPTTKTSSLNMDPTGFSSLLLENTSTAATSSTTNTIAAATLDPTTALSQALSGLLNTPIILAVPILAAVSVATILAWLIVSYANPADPDE